MEKKKPFAARLETFFAGKGFYVVLFLCVAVIGVSAWSLLTGGLAPGQRPEEALAVDAIAESAVPAVKPSPVTVTEAPVRTPQPTPVPTAAPTEAPPPTAAPAAPVQEYYIWPVSGEIAAGYAMEVLAWNPTMRDWRTHDGVDIAAALGTQVKAVTNGRVAEVFDDDLLGTTVVLEHRDGLVSRYSNLAAAPAVAVGDTVGVGQVIGGVGDTALGEAGEVCHLHFAMSKDGQSVDPTAYLP